MYHPIESTSTRRSITNESKASVYFTPNDSVDQPQLQLSPMHINYIRENLDTYIGCLKQQSFDAKFDFDMHRLEANLEREIDRRRKQLQTDDSIDETIEIDSESARMLAGPSDSYERALPMDSSSVCIRMNTLPKRNKFKKTANGRDFYYSLENVFDSNPNGEHPLNLYQMRESNKTINEASETQLTSSASDNCSSNDTSRANRLNHSPKGHGDTENINPSQSGLLLNELSLAGFSEVSSSLPNISKSTENNLNKNKEHIEVDIELNHIEQQPNEKNKTEPPK